MSENVSALRHSGGSPAIQQIRGLQLVHADKRGRWPWDDGYQGVRGGQPVLGSREPTERRRRVG